MRRSFDRELIEKLEKREKRERKLTEKMIENKEEEQREGLKCLV